MGLPRILFAVAALGLVGGCRQTRRAPNVDDSGAAPSAVTGVGFSEPSAVIHDPDYDRYYVANVNSPGGKGFISMLSPGGVVVALKWIDGAAKGVSLIAPRGMAVGGTYLFVTDLSTIRRFDRRAGTPQGEVPIPGARSLGDLDAGADGTLFFADTGDSTAAAAVYRLDQSGKLDTLARGPELGHPTGIAATGDTVWVVNREGEMYRLAEGKRVGVLKLPSAGLTGLVVFGGDAFVSSSEGRSVLRGKLGGPFTPLLPDVTTPANLGHDLWRNRILVPLSQSNEIRIVRLAF